MWYHYRPQRSCGQGNVFTGVCLSTGGEGVCLSACWDAIPPPDGEPPRMETPPDGDPLDGEPPPGWRTPPDGEPPQDGEPRPPRWRTPPGWRTPPRAVDSSIRSTSGRYASYWNAFLFPFSGTRDAQNSESKFFNCMQNGQNNRFACPLWG